MEDTVLAAETPAATAVPAVPPAPLLDQPKPKRRAACKPPSPLTNTELLKLARERYDMDGLTRGQRKEALAFFRSCADRFYMKEGKPYHRVCRRRVRQQGHQACCVACGILPDLPPPAFLRSLRKKQ